MQKIISDLYKNNWGKHGKSEKIYIKKTIEIREKI